MKLMKYILLSAAVAFALTASAGIRWLATEYDFGVIKEAAGPKTGSVSFVNEGPDPTIIQRVKSTCGCTVASYTEDVIMPGDTATVWMEYNPTGRPGRFEKHVKVYTGEQGDLTSITITGTVIGAPATLNASYPYEYGSLRLSKSQIKLGDVVFGNSRHEYISGYNQGSDTLHISWGNLPRSLSLGISSKDVAPGDLFTLSAYFNSRDQGELGSTEIPVILKLKGNGDISEVPVMVTAKILPDTSKYTEQELRDAAMIIPYPTVVELGEVSKSGKPVNFSFTVKNDGRSALQLHRIHSNGDTSQVKIKSFPKQLKPGKEGRVSGQADLSALPEGPASVELELVSNDPLHPISKVRLIATIVP